ncbi:MAG: S41 family peptidase [Saprospiraceae bacterium]|nr:S41 family peptidase [Saprospiraceae bacterium]
MLYQDKSKNFKKLQIWLPLLFAITLVVGMLIGMRMQSAAPQVIVDKSNETNPHTLGQGKIEELIRYVEAKYVDDVNRDELIEKAINGILKELDPHSNYIPSEQLREVNEQLDGNFIGIGVEFMMLDDTVVVIAALAGGPSEAVGIQAGDKIVQVADTTIAGVNMEVKDIVSLLRGEPGSEVEIGINRQGLANIKKYTITRDKIPVYSVDVSYMIDDKTGYIKVNRFSATTYEEFMKALEDLVDNHQMEDLIIDLRHNPGGYLQQATNILSQLFEDKDRLLVYTEGRTVNRNDYESTGRAFFKVDDIAVLIDEGSASASEILAGAIQDHDRGIILGRRSFGKGLVQEQYKLRDGSALRLTVARYYTPSGRSIQKAYKDLDAYANDVNNRYSSGELTEEAKISQADSTRFYTSSGRIVYGGGGISPDIFIPIDTINTNEEYLNLRQHIPAFVFRYMEEEGYALSDYDLASFAKSFKVSDQLYHQFLQFATTKGVKHNFSQAKVVRPPLKRFLKARIAKHLFEDEGFYAIWNQEDDMVNKAIEVLNKNNPISVLSNKQ